MINGAAGTYGPSNFSVATSADTSGVSPSAGETITATATSVTAFTVASSAPTSLVEEADATWTIGFTASSAGALVTGSTITLMMPPGFATSSITPNVALTSTADSFDTDCTASAADPTQSNVIVVTLANASGDTCWLKDSAAAKFTIDVTNGTADTLTSFLLSTSSNVTATSPTSGTAPTLTSAESPAAVSFTTTAPTSLVAYAASTWTINFTTSSTGVLKTGGYIVVAFPSNFSTLTSSPVVTLTSTTGHFDTYCGGTGEDPTQGNVVVVAIASINGNTCKLADSTAASFTIGVINGSAGTYGPSTYSLYTSMDGVAAAPASGSETIVPSGSSSGSSWPVTSPISPGEASAASQPTAPASVYGGATGNYMCDPGGGPVVDLAWLPVANAESYVVLQSSSASGPFVPTSPTPVYSGTTASITYTTSVLEYYEVEAVIGNWWVSVTSAVATNGSLSPGYVVTSATSPECTNN
jgi:hypothetical protein